MVSSIAVELNQRLKKGEPLRNSDEDAEHGLCRWQGALKQLLVQPGQHVESKDLLMTIECGTRPRASQGRSSYMNLVTLSSRAPVTDAVTSEDGFFIDSSAMLDGFGGLSVAFVVEQESFAGYYKAKHRGIGPGSQARVPPFTCVQLASTTNCSIHRAARAEWQQYHIMRDSRFVNIFLR